MRAHAHAGDSLCEGTEKKLIAPFTCVVIIRRRIFPFIKENIVRGPWENAIRLQLRDRTTFGIGPRETALMEITELRHRALRCNRRSARQNEQLKQRSALSGWPSTINIDIIYVRVYLIAAGMLIKYRFGYYEKKIFCE